MIIYYTVKSTGCMRLMGYAVGYPTERSDRMVCSSANSMELSLVYSLVDSVGCMCPMGYPIWDTYVWDTCVPYRVLYVGCMSSDGMHVSYETPHRAF